MRGRLSPARPASQRSLCSQEFTVWETCCRWSLWGHPHPTSRVILAFPPSLLPQAWVGPYCLRPVCPTLGGLSAHFASDAGPTCQAGEHRSPEALPSSSANPVGTVPAAPPSAPLPGCRALSSAIGGGIGRQWDWCWARLPRAAGVWHPRQELGSGRRGRASTGNKVEK